MDENNANLKYATMSRRMGAFLIDQSATGVIWGVCMLMLFHSDADSLVARFGVFLLNLQVFVAYFLWCLFGFFLWKTTPGKKILGLYIVDNKTGTVTNLKHFSIRFASEILTLGLCGMPKIFSLYRADRRSLNDLIASTAVITPKQMHANLKSRPVLATVLMVISFVFFAQNLFDMIRLINPS